MTTSETSFSYIFDCDYESTEVSFIFGADILLLTVSSIVDAISALFYSLKSGVVTSLAGAWSDFTSND